MTDYTLVIVAMSQTIVLLYVASRLHRIHRMMEKLTIGLIRMAEDLNNTVRDIQTCYRLLRVCSAYESHLLTS